MARQSYDDADTNDPRLPALARALNISRRELWGTMHDVRGIFHDRRVLAVPQRDIDLVAGIDAFTEHLMAATIARAVRTGTMIAGKFRVAAGGIYIDGIERSVGYLLNLRERQVNGGKKSAEIRRAKRQLATSVPTQVDVEVSGSGSGSLSDPDPDPDQGAADAAPIAAVLSLFPDETTPKKRKPPKAQVPGYSESVDVYFELYRAANAGRDPTWGAAQGSNLKRLLEHGADEVQRRLRVMYSGAVPFPPPPYDFNTFVRNFDRYAGTPSSRGRWEPESR